MVNVGVARVSPGISHAARQKVPHLFRIGKAGKRRISTDFDAVGQFDTAAISFEQIKQGLVVTFSQHRVLCLQLLTYFSDNKR